MTEKVEESGSRAKLILISKMGIFCRASRHEIILFKLTHFFEVNMFQMKLRPPSVQNPLVPVK